MTDRYKNQKTPWRDAENIKSLYHKRGLTVDEVADELGCSRSTLFTWMDKHEIDRRSRTDHFMGKKWQEKEWLEEQYIEKKKSAHQIARENQCTPKTIQRWLHRHDITIRDASNTPATFRTTIRGYEISQSASVNQMVQIHKLLLCMDEDPHEVFEKETHHKNGVKWDNRLENLELLTKSEHSRLHGLERGGLRGDA